MNNAFYGKDEHSQVVHIDWRGGSSQMPLMPKNNGLKIKNLNKIKLA